jgi:hypothetical protein
MKSPWKLLARFLPQRRPAETREGSIEDDVDVEGAQSGREVPDATEAPSASEHGKSGVVTAAFNPRDPVPDALQEIPEQVNVESSSGPARRRHGRSRGDSATPQPESEPAKTHALPSRQEKAAHAKRTRAVVAVQGAAIANRDEPAQTPSQDSFFDEVAGVDEEIRQLRVQLAQRLHLQNVQLKKMLERFDRS